MDSPVRQQQKRDDYTRHKLFRKIKRRQKAKREQEKKLAEKELRRKFRIPKYSGGKSSDDVVYETQNTEDGTVYRIHPSAFGAKELNVTTPEVVVRPDPDVIKAVDNHMKRLASQSERIGFINPITGQYYMPTGGPLRSVYPEFDLITLGQMGAPLIKQAGNYLWYSQSPAAQYFRYPIGKMMYGVDAKFPTIYRKFKGSVVQPNNDGVIELTNPNPRFAFVGDNGPAMSGQKSPVITNMSYGNSVRSHSSGNWDRGYTLAFSGKNLLGKRVVSTEPSDLFTYGSKITPKAKDVTIISGDPMELQTAAQYGMKTASSPELQATYSNAAQGTKRAYFTTKSGAKLNLTKEDYSKYAREMRKLERQLFGDIRQKDVDFMNFVLRPDIEGKLYDKSVLQQLKTMPDDVGEWVGNSSRRGYLYDDDEFGQLIYDPHSPVESQWRSETGIDLIKRLPQWQRYLYGHDLYGYKNGKAPGIHIKPENRGKFTALKKRTGHSASWFKAHGTPAQKKMATFALNARKWKKK